MKFNHLFREILNNRSLGRALQNHEFSAIKLNGNGLDLGAGTNNGSYYEFLQLGKKTKIQYSDLVPQSEGVLQINLENELPVQDDTQDFIILNNVLCYIYNHRLCIDECYRVLKEGGTIVGSTPFFHRVLHLGADDNYRYTQSCLIKLFTNAGFREVTIQPLGYGVFSSCADAWTPMLKFRPIILSAYLIAIAFDKVIDYLISLVSKNNSGRGGAWLSDRFPIHYFFTCKK